MGDPARLTAELDAPQHTGPGTNVVICRGADRPLERFGRPVVSRRGRAHAVHEEPVAP